MTTSYNMPPKKAANPPKVTKQGKSKAVKKKEASSASASIHEDADDDEDFIREPHEEGRSGTPESVASDHSSVSSRKSCRLSDDEELSLLAWLKDTPCI